MNSQSSPAPVGRIAQLLDYLKSDPANPALLSDVAQAALENGQPGIAADMLARYAGIMPFGPAQTHLAGMTALQQGRYEEAIRLLRTLLDEAPDDPGLRFNIAWSLAMQKDFLGAMDLIDAPTIDALPQAAALAVQILHDQGNFEDALSTAKHALSRHPDHPGLLSITSTLAMDVDDQDLARDCAQRAGPQPEAMTTLGSLALGDQDPKSALALFEQVLKRSPQMPRALVGKGLAQLSLGSSTEAAINLQSGAELFAGHVGSWIAAGWAHVINNNLVAAESCFQKSLNLDHNFAESHGSLAVVRILSGDIDEAKRLTQTAARLDPKSFATALAQALLLSGEGRTDLAQAIVRRAVNAPIGTGGETIAQAIARQALNV